MDGWMDGCLNPFFSVLKPPKIFLVRGFQENSFGEFERVWLGAEKSRRKN